MDTLDFFRELYGQCKEGWLTIWTRQDKRTQWFPVTKLEEASETARRLSSEGKDVYFGIGLRREPVYKEKDGRKYLVRGENTDVIAIPGFWIDVDVAGEAHKKQSLPPTVKDALQLFTFLPYAPSIVVNSGHGIHAYWLFNQPWYFDEADRSRAEKLIGRWQLLIRKEAAKRGWELDNTADLARVLRVPGTTNYKADPLPVQVIKVTEHAEAV